MSDRRRLAEGAVDGRRHGHHVRVRGNDDGRAAVRLEAARGHGVLVMLRLWLRLRLVVWVVPRGDLLVVGRRMGRRIVLGMMVGVRVGVGVVDGRMRLRGDMIVLVRVLPSPAVGRHGGRVRAWHHGCDAWDCCLHTRALARDRAAAVRQPEGACTGDVLSTRSLWPRRRWRGALRDGVDGGRGG
jgi:hypothetical protein